jgi:mxaJ protein
MVRDSILRIGVVMALLPASGFAGAASETAPPLRVCADPNNLPFSNERGEGLENRLARLLADDEGARLEYTWWAQRRGFVRNTLGAGQCDVVMGTPTSDDRVAVTRPYYRSTYVFVTRRGKVDVRSLDDPVLRRLRIGVPLVGDDGASSPPAHALARRGLVRNVVGYSVIGDYREESPPARLVRAVADGEVDVAVAWGPLAGYFAPRQPVPLTLTPVSPSIDPPFLPFVFDIGIGVRRADHERLAEIEAFLERRRPAIDALLAEYGVPRLDLEEAR